MMKTSILFSVLLLAFSINAANAQKEIPAAYLKHLPNDLKLDNSIVRSYRMTTDYYDFDLNSNFLAKRRITGIITYETDSAQWKDVYSPSGKQAFKMP